MSNYSAERLYELLPAVYRQRDADLGYPLRDLIEVIATQAMVLERDIFQLYENWFIETSDDWVVPYIGDLIGVRGTYPTGFSRRAEVANTIGYRRRKGTLAVVEALARDSTGWAARAVEFFELLATTQHVNHLRLHNHRTPDLRRATLLEHLDGPFDTVAHTGEVRPIHNRSGRHNIPNIGIFLWRLNAYPLADVTPHEVDDGTGQHFTFSVLGNDIPLFKHPDPEPSASHIAGEINVPTPIRRLALHENPDAYYGSDLSIVVENEPVQEIIACDLTDWLHEPPPGTVAIDPVLGRLALNSQDAPPDDLRITYQYGFSADIGGGPYDRSASLTEIADETHFAVGREETLTSINDALAEWEAQGRPPAVIEILDSGTYTEEIDLSDSESEIPANERLEIRAANGQRPTLHLTDEMHVTGGEGSGFELNGLLVVDNALRVDGALDRLRLQHCALVPGRSLTGDGEPVQPAAPSLIVESGEAEVTIDSSILGAIHVHVDAEVEIRDSILDANGRDDPAYRGLNPGEQGGPLEISRCTVIGTIHAQELRLGENSIFLGPVTAERRQAGCVRFSHVPLGSQVPRRFRCQPAIPDGTPPAAAELLAHRVAPAFTSLRYGDPGYCQLTRSCPPEIRRGADDESEMGVFSSLQQAQREDNLRIRLEEYLRFGLEAGIFYVT